MKKHKISKSISKNISKSISESEIKREYKSSRMNSLIFVCGLLAQTQVMAQTLNCESIFNSSVKKSSIFSSKIGFEKLTSMLKSKETILIEELQSLEKLVDEFQLNNKDKNENYEKNEMIFSLLSNQQILTNRIASLKPQNKLNNDLRNDLADKALHLQVRLVSQLNPYFEASLNKHVDDIFIHTVSTHISIMKRDPIKYIDDHKIGFPITVSINNESVTLQLLATLDLATQSSELNTLQWFVLVDKKDVLENPIVYKNIKQEKLLAKDIFKPIGNSIVSILMSEVGIQLPPELVSALEIKYKSDAPFKKQIEALFAFSKIMTDNGFDFNKDLLVSNFELITMNSDWPVSYLLNTLTLEAGVQQKIALLNQSIFKQFKTENNGKGGAISLAPYFRFLEKQIPELTKSWDFNKLMLGEAKVKSSFVSLAPYLLITDEAFAKFPREVLAEFIESEIRETGEAMFEIEN